MDLAYISSHTIPLFYTLTFLLGTVYCLAYAFSDGCRRLMTQHSVWPAIVVSMLYTVLLCVRQLGGDSFMFHYWYINLGLQSTDLTMHGEWIWVGIAQWCYKMGFSSNAWLGIFAVGYIGCTIWSCKLLLKENTLMAMVFFLGSFTFLAYGVNTVRNGFACAVVLLALAFWIEKNNKIVFALLTYFAFGCHRTVLMPIIAFLLSVYVIKKPKLAILVWLVALVVVVAFGPQLGAMVSGLGFDERFDRYQNGQVVYAAYFRRVGFRWDFVLYNFAAIFFYWYVAVYRNIEDKKFNLICNTYTLASAMWMPFTYMGNVDRFAYLSWFMMPMVYAYGCIRVPIWKNQDKMAALVLFLLFLFMWIMNFYVGSKY